MGGIYANLLSILGTFTLPWGNHAHVTIGTWIVFYYLRNSGNARVDDVAYYD